MNKSSGISPWWRTPARLALRAIERILAPAPHVPKADLKRDEGLSLCGRTASMRSHFAIGRPLADTQKLSMALHCYELSVRHAMPDGVLNYQ